MLHEYLLSITLIVFFVWITQSCIKLFKEIITRKGPSYSKLEKHRSFLVFAKIALPIIIIQFIFLVAMLIARLLP